MALLENVEHFCHCGSVFMPAEGVAACALAVLVIGFFLTQRSSRAAGENGTHHKDCGHAIHLSLLENVTHQDRGAQGCRHEGEQRCPQHRHVFVSGHLPKRAENEVG